ncbi:MAG: DUF4221 domain-containing protein [Clostridium sp.]|nr:DUF4221 domain-containing protein [Clostridium sp.]
MVDTRDIHIPINGEYSVAPYPQTITPYIVKSKYHYLQGVNGPEIEKSKPGTSIVYDWESDSVMMGNVYPQCYGDYNSITLNWGMFAYRLTSIVVNDNGEITTNFPASDSLYVYNPFTGSRKSYFAGLTEPIEIKPHENKSYEDIFINFIINYQYSGIVYDRYRQLYYRIVLHPYPNYDAENLREECRKKPVSIVILDNEFNKVGETILPDKLYYASNVFVTNEGLNIQAVSDDDDIMEFATFKPVDL